MLFHDGGVELVRVVRAVQVKVVVGLLFGSWLSVFDSRFLVFLNFCDGIKVQLDYFVDGKSSDHIHVGNEVLVWVVSFDVVSEVLQELLIVHHLSIFYGLPFLSFVLDDEGDITRYFYAVEEGGEPFFVAD